MEYNVRISERAVALELGVARTPQLQSDNRADTAPAVFYVHVCTSTCSAAPRPAPERRVRACVCNTESTLISTSTAVFAFRHLLVHVLLVVRLKA